MTGIDGKVIAITGASSGIGEATALLLASRGATVVLGARRADLLDAVAGRVAALEKVGAARVATLVTDVSRRADVAALVDLATARFGRLDALINNAGIGPIAPLDDLRVDDWEAMVDINVKGLLYGIAAALPVFRAQGFGHFLATVSSAAFKTVPDQVVYSATKFAQRTLLEGLRQEAGPKLRVTGVSPGFVDTDFTATVPNLEVRAQMAAMKEAIAIPPSAVAAAFAYAIEQPDTVDVGEIVVRPTAQG